MLCLDLSTTSTGCAIFTKGLFNKSWLIVPMSDDIPRLSTMKYPEGAYRRIVFVADQVAKWVEEEKPDIILIEEINRGINRIAQKSLDALHFFVIDYLIKKDPNVLSKIVYMDSNGAKGWRGVLGLKLSEKDKEYNKKTRESNKRSKLKHPIVDWKVLAQQYVNKTFNFDFDVWENPEDADICDAIALGCAYLIKNS